MAQIFDITILWTVFNDVVTFLNERKDKNKENVVNAHRDINTAFIKTYNYLKNNNGKYIPNIELAEAWNQASSSILLVDRYLGEILYNKSRFWLDPELYINLNRDSEIIELTKVVDEMERLRIKL
ncbi:hypothetical protein NYQ10_17425 [Flavobacterium johnsoniae]|uniref:hypothetical protein n=1 Tax=Flavobacterium johnsoniae TaxID=986 RepID=UPI0025B0E4ED|nr:hypothetical protein [Flavobacterium johnsoniae]WJS93869.1 hypothetical protein NYQ10_17425 [Flavobacterium johnsoniae]